MSDEHPSRSHRPSTSSPLWFCSFSSPSPEASADEDDDVDEGEDDASSFSDGEITTSQ